MQSPYQPLTAAEMARNRARAAAREAHRREVRAAYAALVADLPWLDGAPFPEAATWSCLIDLAVQPTGPLHAWFWGGSIPSDGERLVIRAGTPFGPPEVVFHGPPVGAYVCEPVPEDGRDDEPWWNFPLHVPVGDLRAGAAIEMRPVHGTPFVPAGHHATGDPVLLARVTLALA